MLGDRRSLESSLRPVGAVSIHALIKGMFCFAYILFSTLSARDKVDDICSLSAS